MGTKINLVGKIFGRLLVLKEAGRTAAKQYLVECVCSCGNTVIIQKGALKSGHTTSCGCVQKESISTIRKSVDLCGRVFGNLTVISQKDTPDNKGNFKWVCLCSCGNITEVLKYSLVSKNTSSCGCTIKREEVIGRQFNRLLVVTETETKNYYSCLCECGKVIICFSQALLSGSTQSCGCLKKEQIIQINRHYRISKGRNPDIPMSSEYVEQRLKFRVVSRQVKKRDNYTCCLCGTTKAKRLDAHHIVPMHMTQQTALDHENIITVCYSCHKQLHSSGSKKQPDLVLTKRCIQYITDYYIKSD